MQVFLLIQIPYAQVQIGGKGQPDQIGDLKISGKWIWFAESKNHPQYQCPQQKQPEKSKAIGLGIEEYETPKEIYNKLDDIYV